MYWNSYSSLGDHELLNFVCLPLRGERGNWKKLSLSCGRFHEFPLVAFRNSKTRRHSEIKQTRPSTTQDFSGDALSKQNTEASLASLSCNSSRAMTKFMQLVPGADRVVCHICILFPSSMWYLIWEATIVQFVTCSWLHGGTCRNQAIITCNLPNESSRDLNWMATAH